MLHKVIWQYLLLCFILSLTTVLSNIISLSSNDTEVEIKFSLSGTDKLNLIRQLEDVVITIDNIPYSSSYFSTTLYKDTYYDRIQSYSPPIHRANLLLYNSGYMLRFRERFDWLAGSDTMTFIKSQFHAKSSPFETGLVKHAGEMFRTEVKGKEINTTELAGEKYRDKLTTKKRMNDKAVEFIMQNLGSSLASSKELKAIMAMHQTRRFLLIKPPAEQQHSLPSFWLSADEVLSVGVVGSRRVWSSQMMELEMIDDLSGLASEQVSSRLSVMRQLGRRIEDTLNVRAGGGEKYREGVEATILN